MVGTLTSQLTYSFPIRCRALGRLVCCLTNRTVLFRSFKSRILKMLSFFCYFLPILSGNQSQITWLISVREEPSFFNFFPVIRIRAVANLFGLLLSAGRTFPFFFTWFCLSWVVSPIWAVVIWRQNLSLFFTWFCLSWVVSPIWTVVIWRQNLSFFYLVLSLFGSCFILDCAFSSYDKLILNCDIIKFTCLDFFSFADLIER